MRPKRRSRADPNAEVIRLYHRRAPAGEARDARARRAPSGSGRSSRSAIVVIDNATGEIRARVGAADYSRRVARRRDRHVARAALAGLGAETLHLRARLRGGPRASRDAARSTGRRATAPMRRRISTSSFQGTVTARKALQMSLNLPAIAVLTEVGPARFLARLRSAGADDRAARRIRRPGLAIGLGGVGMSLSISRGSMPALRAAASAAADRAAATAPPLSIGAAPRHRAGRGLVCRRHSARRAAAGQCARRPHRLQDRHVLRLSRRAGDRLRPADDHRGLGRPARQRRRCPA